MRQKLNLITMGVADLEKSAVFFEELGWRRSPASVEGLVLFPLGGITLALHPLKDLAEDVGMPPSSMGFRGITLSYNARSEEEVDAVITKVKELGAKIIKEPQKVYWGGYSSYFEAPGGHLIEVAFNPHWKLDENDNLVL